MRSLVQLALLVVPGSVASQGAADEPSIYGLVRAPGVVELLLQ
jgi:hypothetical protein